MPVFDTTEFNTAPSPAGSVQASITADQVPDLVRAAAKKHGLDPELAYNVARVESNFNPQAHNDKTQAHGVMQLMPDTAKGLGVDINNPTENIDGGVRYLKHLVDKYKGDTKAALGDYGGFVNKDPSVYVNNVLGGGTKATPAKGQVFDPSEFTSDEPKAPPIDYSKLPSTDQSWLQGKLEDVRSAGRAARPYVPWAVGGAVGMLQPELAPITVPLAVGLTRGGEQAGLAQSGQISKEEALQRTLQDTKQAAQWEFGMRGLGLIASPLERWVGARAAGINPRSAQQVASIKDMEELGISAGLGRTSKLDKLKTIANNGMDSIHQKWGNEIASKMDIFRDTAAHYINNDVNAPLSEVEAALGPKGASIIEKIRQGKPVYQREVEAAVNDTDKSNAWGNFFGRKGGDISLNDLRKIKQNLQGSVPYNQTTEGLPQARKVVAAMTAQNIAKSIPDAADAAAYRAHASELEKLINIEELPGFRKPGKMPIGMETASPAAAAIVGGQSGYYTHYAPGAAIARGLAARTMLSAPPTVVHLLNSPFAQQIGVGATGAIHQAVNPFQTRVNLDPDTIKKLQMSILGNQNEQQ